mmetsp:Transcript_77636/g.222447  ORF Transcript_77636/g.222447 Transcript_77636/m.222447 type:complete len:257 (+) Transcript_77636:1023-1793(+)
MPQAHISRIRVQIILQLCAVCRPRHHRIYELLLETLLCDEVGKERPCRLSDKGDTILQVPLQDVGRELTRVSVLASEIRGVAPVWRSLHRGLHHLGAEHLPRLVEACDLGTGLHQQHVVLFGRAPELQRVLALVVRALHLEGLQRVREAVRADVRIGDPCRNQDEVGSLTTDVAKVVLGRLHRKGGLHQPVGVDLVQVHGLLHHRAADAVRLRLLGHLEWNLREQLRMQLRIRLLIHHLEQKLTGVVARVDLDLGL